jgi:2-amino-4-hydroxy-6-hydroxymethyldihydropteridine diphosphokinase
VNQEQLAFLSLGSNSGNRAFYLNEAMRLIAVEGIAFIRISSIYETEPWGLSEQPLFLNQVVVIKTRLSAPALMEKLLEIELKLGRKRGETRWQERTIDVDILFFGNEVIQTKQLTIPHPELYKRRFVLEPLVEVDASFVHPVLKKTLEVLLTLCDDSLKVNKIGLNQ